MDEDRTLTLRPNGTLTFDGIAIGRVDGDQLTVNLGWCKAAGLHVRVDGDPEIDRRRGGVVLER